MGMAAGGSRVAVDGAGAAQILEKSDPHLSAAAEAPQKSKCRACCSCCGDYICTKENFARIAMAVSTASTCMYMFNTKPTYDIGLALAIIGGIASAGLKVWGVSSNYKKEKEIQEKIAALLRLPPQLIHYDEPMGKLITRSKLNAALYVIPTVLQIADLIITPILFFLSLIDVSNENLKNPWPFVGLTIAGLILYLILEPCFNRYGDIEIMRMENQYESLLNSYFSSQTLADPENERRLVDAQVEIERNDPHSGRVVVPILRQAASPTPFAGVISVQDHGPGQGRDAGEITIEAQRESKS